MEGQFFSIFSVLFMRWLGFIKRGQYYTLDQRNQCSIKEISQITHTHTFKCRYRNTDIDNEVDSDVLYTVIVPFVTFPSCLFTPIFPTQNSDTLCTLRLSSPPSRRCLCSPDSSYPALCVYPWGYSNWTLITLQSYSNLPTCPFLLPLACNGFLCFWKSIWTQIP